MTKYLLIKPNYSVLKVFNLFEKHKNLSNYGTIAVCVNNYEKVLGVITIGDLRRLLIDKKNHSKLIEKYINSSFFYVYDNQNKTTYVNHYNNFKKKNNIKSLDHLLVLDKNKKLKSIFRISDILQNLQFQKICVLGLGHVGLPLLNHIAKKGIEVIGYDKNINLIKNLKRGILPFYEKNLNSELVTSYSKNLVTFSNNLKKIEAQVYILCIGTEIVGKKIKNNNFLSVFYQLIKKINDNDVVICRGTFPVGFTRKLYQKFKNNFNSTISFGYCPERIVEGNAVEELECLPQIVSAVNEQSLKKISGLCNKIFSNNILTDIPEEAEFIKLMSNSYRDLIFSFSNEISRLSSIYNIDSRKLINNANQGYERNNIPMPSPGVGGSCLVKDPIIFSQKIKNKIGYKFSKISRYINSNTIKELAKTIEINKKKSQIKNMTLIFGLAFKGYPETSDIRSSTSIDLIRALKKKNFIKVYDTTLEKKKIYPKIYKKFRLKNLKDISKFNMIVFMNNNSEYYELFKNNLLRREKSINFHIFDCWGIVNKEFAQHNGYIYHSLSKTYHS
jgi:nucleotide sugar dehydrogenase